MPRENSETIHIRKCTADEAGLLMPRLIGIFDAARAYMRKNGNMTQWTGGYPSEKVIMEDILAGHFHLVCRGLDGEVAGCFCFRPSPEPNYSVIEGGQWLDDGPYWVVHRLASDGSLRNVGETVLGWCMERCGNLRVDTHADNATMLSLLERLGFERCGTIYVEDGTPRTAFQKVLR